MEGFGYKMSVSLCLQLMGGIGAYHDRGCFNEVPPLCVRNNDAPHVYEKQRS